MWEPFSEPARRAVVRAQAVAQMFGANFIGTEHLAFALAETDDEVGHLLANACDREALRERLGAAATAPQSEMVFTSGAKNAIELAFENARRLDHNYIGAAHLALGLLAGSDPPPLRPDVDLASLRASLDTAAAVNETEVLDWKPDPHDDEPHPATRGMLASLRHYADIASPGTRVSITLAPAAGKARTWTWSYAKRERSG
jgi:hypothetical protein